MNNKFTFDTDEEEEYDSTEAIVSGAFGKKRGSVQLDDDDIEDQLSEAEKRLAKAVYYKAIIKGGVVEDNGTEQAQEVNDEAKAWARSRMAVLLGVRAEAKPAVELFTDDEVAALKKLASKVMGLASAPPEPVVKVMPASTAPEPKIAKVAASKPVSTPEPQNKRRRVMRPLKDDEGKIDYDSIPSGKEFKDVDGSVYKFVDNPNFDPSIPGSRARAKKKLTAQVSGADIKRHPPPDKHMLETYSQIQSATTVDKFNLATMASASDSIPKE